ncbi:hypothetical protein [Phaeacidiphilus oryzae]|jgi:hypothetical protein|uniref:hypothetical protein n=1 Tax=Phaeacidiphilus oryzae TaxID=348818 RepID=UPI000560F10C|nr:hypothetical protein [Phaeacidiphilus oryzae]
MADQTDSTSRALLKSALQRGELQTDTFYPPWRSAPEACAQALVEALDATPALRVSISGTDAGERTPEAYLAEVLAALDARGTDYLRIPVPKRPGETLVARPEVLVQSGRAARERTAMRDTRRERCPSGRIMHETYQQARARTLPADEPYLCEECNWWHVPA